MKKLGAKLTENLHEKFSMEFLRDQVYQNAYGNADTRIARLDPRMLLAWYLFFAIVPWLTQDVAFLLGCFFLVAMVTAAAKVAGLVLFLFAVGVLSQTGYLLVVTWIMGGSADAILPLLVLTLKVATVSLASVTIFSGLDPDRLATGLLWYGFPERLSFSISYAYRILPMLLEEYRGILLSYRLRGRVPDRRNWRGKIRYLIHQVRVAMRAFYPLMLNTAKRARTTVEVLEIRGYRQAETGKAVRKMRFRSLRFTTDDALFALGSVLWMCLWVLGSMAVSSVFGR